MARILQKKICHWKPLRSNKGHILISNPENTKKCTHPFMNLSKNMYNGILEKLHIIHI